MKLRSRYIARGAAVAACYTVLTCMAAAFGLAGGVIQVRLSEALTVLPVFMPEAVPGLFVGCIISNLLTGSAALDVVFGSLATLLGALGTYLIRRKPYLAALPPIISNTLIVPFILAFVYRFDGSVPYFMVTVAAGEIISCGIFGTLFLHCLRKSPLFGRGGL